MAKKTNTKKTEVKEVENINDASIHALNVISEVEAIEAVEEAEAIVEEEKKELKEAKEELKEAKEELKEAKEILASFNDDEEKETKKETKIEEPIVTEIPVIKETTPEETFKNAIAKTPFTIYQNGTLVCTYSMFLNIKTEKKYFEINNKKYSYVGLEFKY